MCEEAISILDHQETVGPRRMSCCLTPVRMDTINPQKIASVGGREKWGFLGTAGGLQIGTAIMENTMEGLLKVKLKNENWIT